MTTSNPEETTNLISNITDTYSCGMDSTANKDFKALTDDFIDIELKDLGDINLGDLDDEKYPWNTKVEPISNDKLTECKLEGNGIFDRIMKTINIQLNSQFTKSRITGHEYAVTYQVALQYALQNSVQFLVEQQNTYWQAIKAQLEAKQIAANIIMLKIDLYIKELEYYIEFAKMQNSKAEYALTKAKIARSDSDYCDSLIQIDIHKIEKQIAELNVELAEEKIDAARAETKETRRDGQPVEGAIRLSKLQTREQTRAFINNAKMNVINNQKDILSIKMSNDEDYPLPGCYTKDSIESYFKKISDSTGLNGTLPELTTLIGTLNTLENDENFVLTDDLANNIQTTVDKLNDSVKSLKESNSESNSDGKKDN